MNIEALKSQVKRLLSDISDRNQEIMPVYFETKQFFKDFLKEDNSFEEALIQPTNQKVSDIRRSLQIALNSFLRYLDNGLYGAISPQREIKISVYNDYLYQAKEMLRNKKLHPATAAAIAGASLEEFLREWCDAERITISPPGNMEKYKAALISKNLIDKQDGKDITSWAGLRNSAAHGEWSKVDNREKIRLQIEGIGLFIRKHS